jgi:hypothetical protein
MGTRHTRLLEAVICPRKCARKRGTNTLRVISRRIIPPEEDRGQEVEEAVGPVG